MIFLPRALRHLLHALLHLGGGVGIGIGIDQQTSVLLWIEVFACKVFIDTVKEMIWSRSRGWYRQIHARKELGGSVGIAKVDGLSGAQQAKLIHKLKHFGRWLMNHSHDGPAVFRQTTNHGHDMERGRGIKTWMQNRKT